MTHDRKKAEKPEEPEQESDNQLENLPGDIPQKALPEFLAPSSMGIWQDQVVLMKFI
jgi:hypothetical protein